VCRRGRTPAATGVSRVAPCSGRVVAGAKEWAAREASVGLAEVWSGCATVEEGIGKGSRGGGHGGPAADWQLHWAARHSRGLAPAFIDGWSLASCRGDQRPLAVVRWRPW
jgi:hypothetical protein